MTRVANDQRDTAIVAAHLSGSTQRAICERFGLSAPRVSQILTSKGFRRYAKSARSIVFHADDSQVDRPDDNNLPPAVDRDACPFCGVRRDIGFRHARALSMGAF
jgi:transcriptional regulator with XRE-family HTH domain